MSPLHHLRTARTINGENAVTTIRKPASSKFPRHKPKADPELAERVLFEEMEDAAKLLHNQEDYGRSGVLHALHSCYSFLHVRGLSGQALKPLINAMKAMESVNSGKLPELFDPSIKPGRLPERKWSQSPAGRETKYLAAACMDALILQEIPKNEAAARVARYVVGWPRVSKGVITANTVANWRDELRQAPSKSVERRYFEDLSRMLRQRSKSYLEEALRIGPALTGGVRKKLKSET
jgi:hypothetical protein